MHKLSIPVAALIDTPGACPGAEVAVITGEGGRTSTRP
jgi:hypothetical protein